MSDVSDLGLFRLPSQDGSIICVLLVGWINVGWHSGFLCEVEASTKCSESEKGSRDSADPLKMASKGSAGPS